MRTCEEIRETFECLGLLSEQERRRIQEMGGVQQAGGQQTYLFHKTSGSAYEMRAEMQDAELESDS